MWLHAFHLVSACVFSPRTSSFTPADILHTTTIHTDCAARTHSFQPRSQPSLLFCGTRKPVCQATKATRMMAHLCRSSRGLLVLLSQAPWSLPSHPGHRPYGGHLRARARTNNQACRAIVYYCSVRNPVVSLESFSWPAHHRVCTSSSRSAPAQEDRSSRSGFCEAGVCKVCKKPKRNQGKGFVNQPRTSCYLFALSCYLFTLSNT